MPVKSQNYDGSVFVPVKRAESYGAIFALTRVTRRGPHGRAGITTAGFLGDRSLKSRPVYSLAIRSFNFCIWQRRAKGSAWTIVASLLEWIDWASRPFSSLIEKFPV